MKKIYLFCSAGMSTSLLVTKMQKAAAEKGIEVEIEAFSENTAIKNGPAADIILLGPQIAYRHKAISAQLPDKIVQVIDMRDYGLVNGEKVLNTALEAMENEGK